MSDLTSLQSATENCHYPELVGKPLRLEQNVRFPLDYVIELFALEERIHPLVVDKFVVFGKDL